VINLDQVVFLVTILTSVNLIIQAAEFFQIEKQFFNGRTKFGFLRSSMDILLALLLPFGTSMGLPVVILVLRVSNLQKWRGLFNGGSDVMTSLALWAIVAARSSLPDPMKKAVFLMLAVQVLASYFVSGLVKLKSKSWRSGEDLKIFVDSSVVLKPQIFEKLFTKIGTLRNLAWLVLVFELALPFLFFSASTIWIAVALGLAFHFTNFLLFGLNRFFWAWLAAYPSLFLLVLK
jgi:hypothetical protein